ncbi:hypothetical protein HDV00_010286 [Rhizophlyctis rosea]|nr:hypothetical protein HDV00_010286 [Rhizophlyctis rosea]
MLTSAKASTRDLKIKTGVVRRIAKELTYYQTEAEKQQARIDKLVAEGADDADIRKQKEVLEETNQMFPDGKRRLAAAHKELYDLVASISSTGDETLQSSEELTAARLALEEVTV